MYSKHLPNKQLSERKKTYLNEQEVAVIIDSLKCCAPSEINEESKTLDIQQQIQLAFQMQANVIKTLNENNDIN